MSLRLLALVLPLALDTFAVCAALAAGGLARRDRRRVATVLVAFEAGMPVVGLVVGRGAAAALGAAAGWVGLACIAAVGVWLLLEGEEDEAPELRLGALLLLGVAVSVDELAIGFAFGLLRVPILWALVVIAAQALVASQLGFRVGARGAQSAGRLAGVVLLVVAALFALARVS